MNIVHLPTREHLLRGVLAFVQAAQRTEGVTRIALLGSLTTRKHEPKDADVLVAVADDVDLAPLAALGRRLKGTAQHINCGADIFLVNPQQTYIGRICHWKECWPGRRRSCRASHCGMRPHLDDDLYILTLRDAVIAAPPVELWPDVVVRKQVPADVEHFLLAPLRDAQAAPRT